MDLLEEVKQKTQVALKTKEEKEAQEKAARLKEKKAQEQRAIVKFNTYYNFVVSEIRKAADRGKNAIDIDYPHGNEAYVLKLIDLLTTELRRQRFIFSYDSRKFQGSDESPIETIHFIRVSW